MGLFDNRLDGGTADKTIATHEQALWQTVGANHSHYSISY